MLAFGLKKGRFFKIVVQNWQDNVWNRLNDFVVLMWNKIKILKEEKRKLIIRVLILLILGGIILGIEYFSKQDLLKEWMGEDGSIENSPSKLSVSSVVDHKTAVQYIYSVKSLNKRRFQSGYSVGYPDNLKQKT